MAKFYVQSGTLQLVTEADDSRGAALWAVHRCLEQVLPICPDDPEPAEEKSERIEQRGAVVLGDTILVNEQGFDHEPSEQFLTLELVSEWNQLITALARLQDRLEAKGAERFELVG